MTLELVDLGAGETPEKPLGHARGCVCTWDASQCLNAKGRPYRVIPGASKYAGRWVAYCCCGGCEFDMTLFGEAS